MPNIEISKIKTRRGTDQQLKLVTLDQGEIVSTTDTKRVYVGTGSGYGGFVVGNKIHPPITNYTTLSTLVSEIGDIVYVNNIYYQLSSSNYNNINSWANVGTKLDTSLLQYNGSNQVTLVPNSISASYIKSSTVSGGLSVISGILQLDFHTNSLEISANKLSLKESGITEREISDSSFGDGLIGGSGAVISLNIDPNRFFYDSGMLSMSGLPSEWFGNGLDYDSLSSKLTVNLDTDHFYFDNGVLKLSSLPSSWFGNGLSYDPVTSIISLTADTDHFYFDNGVLKLSSLPSSWFGNGLSYDPVTSIIEVDVDTAHFHFDSNTLKLSSLPPSWFTDGLTYSSPYISTILTNVDNTTIYKDVDGVISLTNVGPSANNIMANITSDQYGRIVSNTSSIVGTLTGNSTTNSTNTLSAIFNGYPAQALSGSLPGVRLVNFTALSSNGSTITLSSAGFLTFDGPTTTKDGSTVGRFAIPIFSY